MSKVHVKTGDTVVLRTGSAEYKYKNSDKDLRTGKVLEVSPKEGKVIVEGFNMITKHLKPTQMGQSGNIVKAPIVGTYYRSASPDKPPFVKIGDKVKKGDVIMIIESMKLMNEVQSEFDGVVERILVADGQAVEFDQPIMIIK